MKYALNAVKHTCIPLGMACLVTSTAAIAQDWCAGQVTDNAPRSVPALSKPAPLQPFNDPTFNTRITRITDAPYGTVRRNLYNTVQPWNADESLLMLYHTGGEQPGHHLYDGQSYQHLRAMDFSAADIEGIYWDDEDPAVLYFVQRRPAADELYGKVVRYDINTSQRSLVADLTPVCGDPRSRGWVLAKGGNDIQGMHNNQIGLRCQQSRSHDISFSVNVDTGAISRPVVLDPARPQGNNANGFRPDVALSPLPSGSGFLVQDTVFDQNMNFSYQIDGTNQYYRKSNGRTYEVPKLEHSSIGRMPNGNDALFTPRYNSPRNACDADDAFGVGSIVAYDLAQGSCHVMVGPSTGWGYPLSGVHLSAVSQHNPGWVTATTLGYRNLDHLSSQRQGPTLFSELSLTYADPDNPRTCRLAHVRTHGKSARQGHRYRGGYFGEAHAIMSPSGSRILFNSDWHDSGSVDAYVVELNQAEVLAAPAPLASSRTSPQNSPQSAPSTYSLAIDVATNETPARVYVNFVNANAGPMDGVTIARAGSPDTHRLMWLYANGTQRPQSSRLREGRLSYRQQYLGTGEFEARLFLDGDMTRVAQRQTFTIGAE